jgi:phage terminase large subunit-like protein
MGRKVFHQYRSMARDGVKRAGEVELSPEARRAQLDFPFFCEYLTRNSPDPKVQPPHMAEWNQHLLTGDSSQALEGIAGPSVDILSPRGSAKSTYLGMFAAWAIGRHTMAGRLLQILYISYTVDVARPKSAAIKAIIESPEYREIFPSVVPGRKWSDEYWCIDYEFAGISTVGAEVFTVCCAGLKGAIVSKRSHLILLDDLIKSEFDIANPEIRQQMRENWTRSILPTMFDGGRAICLGTRFRADDLHCTTFTEANGWVQIEQSAIIDDPDSEAGEKSYWDFWSLEHLKHIRTADPIGFSFQYQNKIIRTTEVSIHPEWIKKANTPTDIRRFDRIGLGIDLSSKTKERHDYTVMILGGRIGNKYYILDMWRGRLSGNKSKLERLLDLLYEWDIVDFFDGQYISTALSCYLWAEDVAYQASLQGDFKSYVVNELGIHNLIYKPVHSKGDKLSKLRSVTGLFENELVVFNQAAALGVAIDELISFGATAHDDCADAITFLLNGLRQSAPLDIVYG